MPTGVALRDVREQLFAAAERVLLRDGPNALTSRAVTAEAGVAKGVLHRHFADFDDFLAELVRDRAIRIAARMAVLEAAAGTGTVAGNLTAALTELFGSVAASMVGLIIFRDELRARLRRETPHGIPILSDAGRTVAAYLAEEQKLGRIAAGADLDALGLTIIGGGHLLSADRDAGPPDADDVHRLISSVLRPDARPPVGATDGPGPGSA